MSAKGMLRRLRTELGEKSTYDAVSQCSRCGYCEQACPTYVATGEEGLSPRGRNQALRLLLEGKLKEPQTAARLLDTCLLCGACATACYAHVRVPDLVLEGRRLLRGGGAPAASRLLSWLLLDHPGLFEGLLRAAYLLKRAGLGRLAARLGLFRLAGLPGLAAAEEHVSEVPSELLAPRLRERPELADSSGARWLYFAPCGPNFVLPKVGLATVAVLESQGRTAFLNNRCCGLLAYNYGELSSARESARRVIAESEARLAAAGPEAEIVGDCSSCVAHLKAYPQLFLEEPEWKARAEAFARRVRDVVEVLPAEGACGENATYHDSCRARHGQGISKEPREFMRSCSRGFTELPEADACCGGAGAFAFLQPELSDEVLRRKISRIAETGAKVVATSSTSCLLQLAHGLRKYYPECRVAHVSEIAAAGLGATAPRHAGKE
ncbi:MAG: (Fe-S)-binding protein [Elusimicrobia bacterium]|nr:(Fe-S)-binding protein [Elusimicrobiota bacterium]